MPQVKRDKLDKKEVPSIFTGYSTVSKAYKVYQPQTEKILISRDVHFIEDRPTLELGESQKQSNNDTLLDPKDLVDDLPVRGTKSISDIYHRCNIAICEPASYVWGSRREWKMGGCYEKGDDDDGKKLDMGTCW